MCVHSRPVWVSHPPPLQEGVVILSSFLSLCLFSQSEQKAKKGEDLEADDEKIGEDDSNFMKLAKKLTAKTLQRKGRFDTKPHKKNPTTFKNTQTQFLSSNNYSNGLIYQTNRWK